MTTLSNNGILTFSRGDSISFPLFINAGTKTNPMRYTLHENENLFVGIMEPNMAFEAAIVKQKYTKDDLNEDGDVEFTLSSEVTQKLRPGKYYYEVKLIIYNEETPDKIEKVITVIPRTALYIEGGIIGFMPCL